MRTLPALAVLLLAVWPAAAQRPGSAAEYLGGTLANVGPRTMGWLLTTDPVALAFQSKKNIVRIPYDRIDQIEYGQKVDRRVLEAVLLSPLFVLTKRRDHYVTVGFAMDDGQRQALLFRVEKDDVRALLVALEARTGRTVVFQDDEARKAGK
jgi:hypothetical protein